MGVLANHVPSIEQLKPGLIEVIEESGGSKQFFRTYITNVTMGKAPRPRTDLAI
jgi:F-type H+-transporting ATPase subunit delta